MSKNNFLDATGLKIYDTKIKEIINNNAYFVGTKEEYTIAYSEGKISDGMLVITTDDIDEDATE